MIPGLRREGKRMELSKSRSLEEMPDGAKLRPHTTVGTSAEYS